MGDSDTFSVTQGRLCLMDEVFVFSQSGHVKISDILGSSHSPPTLVDCQAEIMSAANNPEARLEHGDPAVVVAGLEQVATPKRCFFCFGRLSGMDSIGYSDIGSFFYQNLLGQLLDEIHK